ncbi:serpin family protein [Mycoplasmatota bacterium]|nr:serpin family protein [Mycoplasmatota bacterium]
MNKLVSMLFLLLLSVTLLACERVNKGVENPLVTKGNSEFAFDIFRELNNEDYNENIFISPYSISSALAMTLNGAEGNTKSAMEDTLKLTDISMEDINNGFAYINHMLMNLDKDVKINIANSLWLRDEYELNEQFKEDVRFNFDSIVSKLDFNDTKSSETINNWVSDETSEMIDKIIKKIDPSAVLYLVNAIYFNGSWQDEFDPEMTKVKDFNTIDNTIVEVDMMRKSKYFSYYENEEIISVRIPYGDGKVSMYCILPRENTDINSIVSKMNQEKWLDVKNGMHNHYEVTLELPKFRMEYGIEEISGALKHLGMGIAFDSKAEGFPYLIEGNKSLYISEVNHKAVVDVSEKGTEAAAATSVKMKECEADNRKFIVNRPFMFIIGDDEGNILFMGKKVK